MGCCCIMCHSSYKINREITQIMFNENDSITVNNENMINNNNDDEKELQYGFYCDFESENNNGEKYIQKIYLHHKKNVLSNFYYEIHDRKIVMKCLPTLSLKHVLDDLSDSKK